jgi:hypothetical protein
VMFWIEKVATNPIHDARIKDDKRLLILLTSCCPPIYIYPSRFLTLFISLFSRSSVLVSR